MKLKEVRFETFIPENTDIIVMHCTGSQTAKDAFFSFWFTEDHRKWLAHVGRQINVQDIDHTTWRILLRPILPMPSMPASVLLEALFWQLAQTIFQACQVADGIDCLFKMFGQRLCRVFLAEDCSLEPFLVALEHIRQLHPRRGTPSLHSSGKRCTEALRHSRSMLYKKAAGDCSSSMLECPSQEGGSLGRQHQQSRNFIK